MTAEQQTTRLRFEFQTPVGHPYHDKPQSLKHFGDTLKHYTDQASFVASDGSLMGAKFGTAAKILPGQNERGNYELVVEGKGSAQEVEALTKAAAREHNISLIPVPAPK